jgi:peptidoglycan-N-acetylglucosamine deacetylase
VREDVTRPVGHLAARPTRALGPVGLALAGGVFLHLLPGVVAWRSARCRLLPRLSGVGRVDHVALTFDDGPDPMSTPKILDGLDVLGWKATFFVLGCRVRGSRSLTEEIVARGHELGVHGDRHISHLRRPATWTVPDLLRARDAVGDITGETPRWFRPPYGALSASSLVAARRAGLQVVLWTTWGIDWKPESTGLSVRANVRRTFVPGATVLLHDSDHMAAPGSWKATVAALPMLAEDWRASGLKVGPLHDHGVGARW